MNVTANPVERPWYREPWPWLLMLGPAIVIVAGVITTIYAIQSFDGLVSDDYYKRGLAVNQEIGRVAAAVRGQVNARLAYDRKAARVNVRVTANQPLPRVLTLRLAHPTRASEDLRIALTRSESGDYSASLAGVPELRWKVHLETSEWVLTGDWVNPARDALELAPRG